MLFTNLSRDLHSTSQEPRLQSLVTTSHLKISSKGGMNIAKLDRWSLELQEFDISLEFIQGKLNKIANIISRLKNKGLYVEHLNEKPVSVKILQDRIEKILDIATNPSNFESI